MQISAGTNQTKRVRGTHFRVQILLWWQLKQNRVWYERTSLGSLKPISHDHHLLCCEKANTKNSVSICHMWMRTGGLWQRPHCWRFLLIYPTHTHNPCHCVLHPRRDTGNSQVPACFTEKCSNRKFHKMLRSWLEPSGWRLQSFSLLFHRPHSRFSSTTVVSDIISEPAGKLFCYTCERVRTPSGSSHTAHMQPNQFKVAFTCPQLVRVLKAYNNPGLQS